MRRTDTFTRTPIFSSRRRSVPKHPLTAKSDTATAKTPAPQESHAKGIVASLGRRKSGNRL